jgi:hypothetical protein
MISPEYTTPSIAIFNLYDRQRDLSLPTSFLISGGGDIVKVDQGSANPEHVEQDFRQIPQTPAERLAKALPFPGVIPSGFARRSIECRSPLWVRQRLPEAGEAQPGA